MNLIELSVRRPVATGVIYTLVCAAGIFSWIRLPQEVMPDLNFPQLTIVTHYAQAAPQEIENLVTKPIEEAVGTVKNVNRVHSVSKEGTSIVTVEFAWGTNMDFASLNVREKLDLVKSRLPSDIREPMLVKYNPFYTPVLILSLNAEGTVDPEFLSHVAQKTVANKLQKVEGVAAVQLSGTAEKEIQVDLDQNRLAANRVSILQFDQALAKANYRGAAGTAKEGSFDYSVRVVSPFDGVEDIGKAVIGIDSPSRERSRPARDKNATLERERQRAVLGDERLIAVSQLGAVSEGLKEASSFSRYDGKSNVTIMIQKQASASTVRTARKLKDSLEEIRPLLPSDISLSVIYDQADIIQKGINDVLRSIFEGGILAFLVLYFFLKSWRDAMIVSVVIPSSVLITIVIMGMMGMSLNTISMGGLALGIGHLVDASICVTENIHRRKVEVGEPLDVAVIRGTEEVGGAVASSILTSIAVFLPLLFVLGLLGQLFRDLSLTMTISQTVSLLVSLTLVPMLAYVFGGEESRKEILSSPLMEKIKVWYLPKLHYSLAKPRKVWGMIIGAFVLSIFILSLLPREFMPHVDADQFVIKLTMPNGTRLDKTNEITGLLDEKARSLKEVEHATVTVGSSSDSGLVLLGKNESRILVDLAKKRKRRTAEVMAELREKISADELKGGRVEISAAGGPLSFAQGQTSLFMVYLKGFDLGKLKKGAAQLKEKLAGIAGLVQIRDSLALPAPEVRLNIDKERAARAGLTVTDIGQTAMVAYHGKDVTQIYQEGKEIQVRVRLREEDRRNSQELRGLLLPSSTGGTVPLQDVAQVEIGEGPSQIERLDQERFVLVQADGSPSFGRASNKQVQKLTGSFTFPDLTLEIAGEKKAQRESFTSLIFIILVSVLLVFMVMAVQFESLKQPFLILFSIPLSVIGMAIGLFLMGKSVNAMAGMGLLLLGGIVVNNGIVLIDFVNTSLRENSKHSLRDALLHSCQTRLRPILLTAATTVVGLVPLALGIGEGAELQAPMAITVIFGLAVSTVLTLIAMPSLFLFLDEHKVALRLKSLVKKS